MIKDYCKAVDVTKIEIKPIPVQALEPELNVYTPTQIDFITGFLNTTTIPYPATTWVGTEIWTIKVD